MRCRWFAQTPRANSAVKDRKCAALVGRGSLVGPSASNCSTASAHASDGSNDTVRRAATHCDMQGDIATCAGRLRETETARDMDSTVNGVRFTLHADLEWT